MANTASRLITLIMLLQRKPNQKAGELAEELAVSVRSVHRYIATLEEMGIPIYSERGPHGGFSLARGYRMPPLVFTPEEAVAVYLGTSLVEEMWGRLYRDAARGVLAKLDNLLPDEQRQEVAWARRKLVATSFHRGEQEPLLPNLEKIRRAVHERRRLAIDYRRRENPEPSRRLVDPYALVHQWGWWYVVGFCHLRKDKRTFRIDRIQAMTLTDQTFDEPHDFDIHLYLADVWKQKPKVHARMCFSRRFASIALADRWQWDAVEQQAGGSVEVAFTAPNLEWAASTALAYGGAAIVTAPDALKALVKERALGIAAQYESLSDHDDMIDDDRMIQR